MTDFKQNLSNPNVQKKIKTTDEEIHEMKDKIVRQHQMIEKLTLCLRTYDAKIEALQELGTKAEVFSKEDFENSVDFKVGLRRRADNEIIETGDIVFVNYQVTVPTGETVNDESFILKVGSNTVIFEEAVLGKPVSSKGIEYEAKYKGKEESLKFKIDVVKVKTRLKEDAPVEVKETPKAEVENGPVN